jgi:outer membrane protein with beta-barrel domain
VRHSICASAVLFILLGTSHSVFAQDAGSTPRAEIKVIVGASDFGDDNESYPHFVAGVASRIHLSRHWSIEPEFNYMRRSSNDQDYIFQPNVVYEFNSVADRVVPYLIGGVGVIQHKSVYYGSDFVTGAPVTYDTSYRTWTANGGAGLKVFLSKHLFVAPEARLGTQPTARATVSIGYVFSGQD